jgi:hypothetical protein
MDPLYLQVYGLLVFGPSLITAARMMMLVLPKSSAPTMQSRRFSRLKQEQYRKSHHCPAGRFYTERRHGSIRVPGHVFLA